jgi:hypothetical protein
MKQNMTADISIRSLKFAILKCLASERRAQHKFTLIGQGNAASPVESVVGLEFNPAQRHLAVLAFNELEASELIRPTYSDMLNPEEWVEITEGGREALRRQQLDSLDGVLGEIAPHLVELRAGAWSAIASNRPDALRQAAHSGRELIDQVLKEGAPDEIVRNQSWFQPAKDSRSGITRRQRLRFLMESRRQTVSDSDLEVADRACDLVMATDDKLKAIAHGRGPVDNMDVRDALVAAEIALRRILVQGTASHAAGAER